VSELINFSSRIKKRSEEFWSEIKRTELKKPYFIFHFIGWLISFLFVWLALDSAQSWIIIWIIFLWYFWYNLNNDIFKILNPPFELVLILFLIIYWIEFFLINRYVQNLQNGDAPLDLFLKILMALLILLFGLLLTLNSRYRSQFSTTTRSNQFDIVFFIIIGFLAYFFSLFEHEYYLYLFQFFLFLLLINKTSWLEKLTKTELWTYFFVFLVVFFRITDPPFLHNINASFSTQNMSWFSISIYVHLLIKIYFLVLLIKIPIVIVYNHGQLSRKLWMAGLFQSTFPQLIQFSFLLFIFYLFISAWQADNLREKLYLEIEKNRSSDINYYEFNLNNPSQFISIDQHESINFTQDYPEIGILAIPKIEHELNRNFRNEDYYLYTKKNQKLLLLEFNSSFAAELTKNISLLAGSGLLSYPYVPNTWQFFIYDFNFLKDKNNIQLYPFGITSLNKNWNIISSIITDEENSSITKVEVKEAYFSAQKFIIGRTFIPVVNGDKNYNPYFAIDIYFILDAFNFTSTMAKIFLVLSLLFLLFNMLVIRRFGKFGEEINKIIIQKFDALKLGIKEMATGNLNYKFNMKGEDEFVELATYFNQMGDKLKATIADVRDRDRLDHELKIARQVQISLLPRSIPEIPGFKVTASLKTANEIGGDFYDLIKINKSKYLFTIGDVSGKGSSAAFYMAQFISLLRFSQQFTSDPIEIVSRINEYFATQVVDRQIFITAIVGTLDIEKSFLSFVRSGHTSPILIPKDSSKEILEIKSGGLGIGLTNIQSKFKKTTKISKRKFEKGDILILYTDGVVEAARPSKSIEGKDVLEVYGDERLRDILIKNRQKNAEDLLKTVLNDLDLFYGKNSIVDDHTLLIIEKV
jgi:serine phosphatase RsbU (regulator of sigma subunit)